MALGYVGSAANTYSNDAVRLRRITRDTTRGCNWRQGGRCCFRCIGQGTECRRRSSSTRCRPGAISIGQGCDRGTEASVSDCSHDGGYRGRRSHQRDHRGDRRNDRGRRSSGHGRRSDRGCRIGRDRRNRGHDRLCHGLGRDHVARTWLPGRRFCCREVPCHRLPAPHPHAPSRRT